MKKWIVLSAVVSLSVALAGCKSTDEPDAIAKAQKCLDEASVYSDADACLSYVEDYTSQQAQILKCSILHTSGGLMEDKIIKGYNALKDDSITNKEAAFMAVLSLDKPNLTSGLTKAQRADAFCQETGVPGLKYLSSVIVAGTAMNATIESVTGTGIDVNTSPAAMQTALTTMLNDCGGATPSSTCDDNLITLGTAAASLSASYCANSNADSDVCKDINDAVAAAGNNATNIGQAVLCYMKNKTYNAGIGLCNP
jgi:outer membrane murein-binding lipoprotein Lpp